MQVDNASFWADIKNYEERLSLKPDSYIFAKLSEIYLKVGLVDDALYTARQGVSKYPGYVAGQRSLALACHAKGLLDESRELLEKVTTAIPEDIEAQKFFGRLLVMSGSNDDAERVFRTVLEFYPDDAESRIELEAIEQSKSTSKMEPSQDGTIVAGIVEPADDLLHAGFGAYEEPMDESEEIIEDIEILEMDEADLVEDDGTVYDVVPSAVSATMPHDPLSTVTLAELYVQQGFIDKALDIYRDILAEDPLNSDVQLRIAKLEKRQVTDSQAVPVVMSHEGNASGWTLEENISTTFMPPAQGKADNLVSILEVWLDNIRRMKVCR